MKNKINQIVLYSKRITTLSISICLGLVGMATLEIIDLPDMVIRFVGYLLIVSAIVYILKSYK